jgi:hypothetical protein
VEKNVMKLFSIKNKRVCQRYRYWQKKSLKKITIGTFFAMLFIKKQSFDSRNQGNCFRKKNNNRLTHEVKGISKNIFPFTWNCMEEKIFKFFLRVKQSKEPKKVRNLQKKLH